MIQWLKEHIAVISFGVAVITSILSFIIWLDAMQDSKIATDIINPLTKDIHDEVLLSKQETLINRQHTIDVDKKVNELEKQSVRMEQKIDDMIKMMQKEFNNKGK